MAVLAIGVAVCTGEARAQNFGTVYGFGDSLTDNGYSTRIAGVNYTVLANPLWTQNSGTNGPIWFDRLPGLIGASATPTSDYAIGGAISGQFPGQNGNGSFLGFLLPATAGKVYPGLDDQVSQFISGVGRLQPNDVATIWIGTNDFTAAGLLGLTPSQVIGYTTSHVVTDIQRLAAVGGRNFVVINLNSGSSASIAAYNNGLPAALAPLAQSGLNIHLFDFDTLLKNLRANPTSYGLAPDAATICNDVPSCRSGATTNQYITFEGIHFTATVNNFLAMYIANQINAPFTMPVQAEMAQQAAVGFASGLLGRLDASHFLNDFGAPSNAYAMATKAPPRSAPDTFGRWSVFAMGSYVHANGRGQNGVAGADNDLGAGTLGLEYHLSRNLLVGAALGYSDSSTTLGLQNTNTQLKSYQFAGFASSSSANWFGDLVVSYGLNDYKVRRDSVGLGGFGPTLSASPAGSNFVASARVGYLFDTAVARLGPIGGLTYSRVWIDGYTESGDPLLTQAVRNQAMDGWTASAGLQVRLPAAAGPRGFNPFFNLTAEQDFGSATRTIVTAQTYALALPVTTLVGTGTSSHIYGKAAGGALIDLGGRFSANINIESTFARQNGNVFTAIAGITARL
ncbi:MAG: autotransporter domain-containing protein [Pseudomonadota bacterium]